MTYCLGIAVDEGLIFAADSRTSAGVDSVAIFRKLFVFERPGERSIALLTAGNLAVTQEVVSMVDRALETDDPSRSLFQVDSMFFAAQIVGGFLRSVFDRDVEYFKAHGTEFNASLIIGGQIAGERPRLFLIYSAGNFIESSDETPYFQLGETKYGKPILERVMTSHVGLAAATKCALVSFDSTIKANVSVAPPIDLITIERDTYRVAVQRRINDDDEYFTRIRQQWGDGLRRLFSEVPDPPWQASNGPSTAKTP